VTGRTPLTWREIRYHHHDGTALTVYDQAGVAWERVLRWTPAQPALWHQDGDYQRFWTPADDDPVLVDLPPIAEPPDGTRIEFEHCTDVYAAWRDDASSAQAGYEVGDGGEVWCLFGTTVPRTWTIMWLEFGASLATAVRLVPHPDDVGNYGKWPTAMMRPAD
jgi:hypothetical protein